MANVTSATKGFPTAQEGFTTTLASTITSGASTVPLNSVSGYSNGDIVALVIEPTSTTKKQAFTGTVDTVGVQITGVVWTEGTNASHTAGVTVVDYETATAWALNAKFWRIEHNDDGTHKAITTPSLTATGAVQGATVIATTSVTEAGKTLQTIRSETLSDFVASGLVWSGDAYASTRAASMTAGVVYIGGKPVAVSAVTARSFTASKDTYVDVDNAGTLTYTEVANNAASPALAANNLRVAIVITGASNIASVASINQGQTNKVLPIASNVPYTVADSLGNRICNRSSNKGLLNLKQQAALFNTVSTTHAQITGLEASVVVNAGDQLRIIYHCNEWTAGGLTTANAKLWDGAVVAGTQLGVGDATIGTAGYNAQLRVEAYLDITSSGTKTFRVSGSSSTANGVNFNVGILTVEKIN